MSRNNQPPINNAQQSQQPKQPEQLTWKPIDIPRVDDIKHQPQTIQPPVIQVQQDPQLIKTLFELQRTNSQLEQTTSKLQELQETVLKLQRDNISQQQQQTVQPQIPQTTIEPKIMYQLEQTTSISAQPSNMTIIGFYKPV